MFNKEKRYDKKLNRSIKKELNKIPKTTLETIPYLAAFEDGIFELENKSYSKALKFDDISFSLAREDEQISIFQRYCKLLNGLNDANLQLTIINNKIEIEDFQKDIFFKNVGDELDVLRNELNKIMKDSIEAGKSNFRKELYATVTINCDSYKNAKIALDREIASLKNNLSVIGTISEVINLEERLKLMYSILNKDDNFIYDKNSLLFQGLASKSLIAPNYLEFNNNNLVINDRYYRVLYLKTYANYITDSFLTDLSNSNMESIISIHISPMSKAKAIKMTNNKITEMMSEKMRNKGEYIPLELQNKIAATESLYKNLSKQNQKFFFSTFTILLSGETMEELDENTKEYQRLAEENACTLSVLNFQQEAGLINSLPLGINKLSIKRGLNTESMAIASLPFSSVELLEEGGLYFGRNSLSNKLLVLNKSNLGNSNMFIYGVPGSGKSYLEKFQAIVTYLKTDDYFMVADMEGEFVHLTEELNGQVIEISSTSKNMMNLMDISEFSEEALLNKSDFITSIFNCLVGYELNKREEGILNRAVRESYREYIKSNYNMRYMPTVETLKNNLKKENSELHEYLDIFIEGNLKNFNTKNRFNIDNRFICFNLKNMEESNKKLALLIVINTMWGSISKNYKNGVRTNIILEEFKSIITDKKSTEMLDQIVSRTRKYGGSSWITSQNISSSLQNAKVIDMISNSEILVLMKQSKMDAKALQNSVLNLTDDQINTLITSKTGDGILVYGNKIVPFTNQMYKNSNIYKLLNTNFDEVRGAFNGCKY